MSAIPPKADMCSALADVRFVPIADIALKLTDEAAFGTQLHWRGQCRARP
jgi:hypothetical protein